jgi:uncharacterized protein YcfJ
MKKLAIAILTISATACATADVTYDNARVLSSTPIYRTVEISTPERQCWREEVARTDYRDRGGYNSHTPDLLGAVIGGALGNELGHNKSNKRVGAVVGALLGGSIARDLESRHRREAVTYYDTVQRCETVNYYRQEEKLVGYDVLYSYNGRDYSIRMPNDPGAYVRVRVDVEPVY